VTDSPVSESSTDAPVVPLRRRQSDAEVAPVRRMARTEDVPQWLSARNPTDAQVASVRRHPAARLIGPELPADEVEVAEVPAIAELTPAQRAALGGHPLAGLRVVRQLDRELGAN